MRLDSYLVENALAPSRTKAAELIKDGSVSVDSKIIKKTSFEVADGSSVEVADVELYVSRAALKLKGFLPYLPWDISGLDALDIGSSTGGFAQILLENNIKSVSCVDVGRDQLHESIRADERVSVYESTDIRNFTSETRFDIVVCDVSFISLNHIIDDIDRLASKYIVVLFKPQFEVGRDVKRDKNGVVKDDRAIYKSMIKFEDMCALMGWKMVAKELAIISGKDGNEEICYGYIKD